MNELLDAFGDLIDNITVIEPPTYGLFRVRREKTYNNYPGQYEEPLTATLLKNLRLPDNADALMTENGSQTGQSRREGLAAIAAMRVGAIPAPLIRGDGAAVDFYDGHGIPFDVKTPKPGYSIEKSVESVIHEMEGSQDKDGITSYKSRVVLDTTFLTNGERGALWGKLSKYVNNRRLIEVYLPYSNKAKVWRLQELSATGLLN